jgi:hypothetical protein
VVQSAAESVYKVVGVRRGVAKTGHKMGRFWPCWRGWQIDGRAPTEKSFHCRERARQVYHGTVFEVKKEIPVELQEADGCPGRL